MNEQSTGGTSRSKTRAMHWFPLAYATDGGLSEIRCQVCGGQCGHLAQAWADNMNERVVYTGKKKAVSATEASYGSEVGWIATYETCPHVIRFRVKFHKGSTYIEWLDATSEALDYEEEMPRG